MQKNFIMLEGYDIDELYDKAIEIVRGTEEYRGERYFRYFEDIKVSKVVYNGKIHYTLIIVYSWNPD